MFYILHTGVISVVPSFCLILSLIIVHLTISSGFATFPKYSWPNLIVLKICLSSRHLTFNRIRGFSLTLGVRPKIKNSFSQMAMTMKKENSQNKSLSLDLQQYYGKSEGVYKTNIMVIVGLMVIRPTRSVVWWSRCQQKMAQTKLSVYLVYLQLQLLWGTC